MRLTICRPYTNCHDYIEIKSFDEIRIAFDKILEIKDEFYIGIPYDIKNEDLPNGRRVCFKYFYHNDCGKEIIVLLADRYNNSVVNFQEFYLEFDFPKTEKEKDNILEVMKRFYEDDKALDFTKWNNNTNSAILHYRTSVKNLMYYDNHVILNAIKLFRQMFLMSMNDENFATRNPLLFCDYHPYKGFYIDLDIEVLKKLFPTEIENSDIEKNVFRFRATLCVETYCVGAYRKNGNFIRNPGHQTEGNEKKHFLFPFYLLAVAQKAMDDEKFMDLLIEYLSKNTKKSLNLVFNELVSADKETRFYNTFLDMHCFNIYDEHNSNFWCILNNIIQNRKMRF